MTVINQKSSRWLCIFLVTVIILKIIIIQCNFEVYSIIINLVI